ncbi:beta strand repeat-containing protein [Methanosphaera sp.]
MKHKNMKSIFLLVTLVFLFTGITALSAADTVSNTTDVSTSDVASVAVDNSISTDIQAIETSDNKNTQATKTIKSEGESVNLYVSDSIGSDDNDGSSDTTPFKTIEKAISSTTDSGVYNIYIAEGVYKGLGNTNLTVSGANTINFIGSGINKTVFDGEANYTIKEEGFYWGSSSVWKSYVNATGNWFMNITEGNGKITITNMTFQKGWVKGGSSTSAYKLAPIDNYATLDVDNVYFYSNFCGVGSALRNRPGATLTVNNSVFDSNRKSDSTGNSGIIYNNGTTYVYNSLFTDNYARWGVIANDKILNVINSTFRNGIGYDGASGFKSGTGIYMNTGSLDYYTVYNVDDIQTLVENCTFENNQQCDIHIGFGQATIRGNVFNQSTGIYEVSAARSAKLNLTITHLIENNQFINIQPSTLLSTMLTTTTPSFAFYTTTVGYNTTIRNNTIDVPNTQYGYALRLTGYATVINNTMNNYVSINGHNNTITGNTITTARDYAVVAASSNTNNTVTNNTLISGMLNGNLAVNASANNVVENNLPAADVVVITNDNYTTYFNDDGTMKNGVILNGSKILLSGDIINKTFIFDDIKVLVTNETAAQLVNSTIITRNNAAISLSGIIINNTDSTTEYTVLFNSTGNKIVNSQIIVDTTNTVRAVIIDADGNTITGTTINVTGPSLDVDWSGYPIGLGKNIGVLIRSSNNLINNSRINVTFQGNGTEYGSVYGVEIQSPVATEVVTGNEIRNSRIYATGDVYAYALNMVRADNTATNLSYFTAESNFMAYAMQLSGPAKNNTIAGYATAIAPTAAYGAYVTGQWSGVITDNSFEKYYLQNVNSSNAYGIVLEGVSNTIIGNATYNLYGTVGEAISLTNANGTEVYGINVNQYTTDAASKLATVTNSNDVTLRINNMVSQVGTGVTIVDSDTVNVTGNYINIGNVTGGNAAVSSENSSNIVNESNTPTIALLTDDTYSTYFDENSKLREDITVSFITIGGDLHGKDLIFTKAVDLRNAANYTIYNGTITFEGNVTGTSNLTKININNVDKPAIVTDLNNTMQATIYVRYSTINVTGDNVTAIISERKPGMQQAYISVQYGNITVSGKNATYMHYKGNATGTSVTGVVETLYSNIDVTAEDTSIVYDIDSAIIYFRYNNITQSGKNTATIFATQSVISSSSGFQYNKVVATGDNITAIYAVNKLATGYSYIYYNNITLNSDNPTTAMTIDGRNNYVSYNNITVNTYNGETPIISAAYNTNVYIRYNYLLSYDVCGNAAVEAISGITITGNTPTALPVVLTVDDITGYVNQATTITATITDLGGNNNVAGIITFTDAEGNVIGTATIDEGVATVEFESKHIIDSTITATYTGEGAYATNSTTANIVINRLPTTITVDPVTASIGDVITLSASITDSENNAITDGKVVFKVNGKTLRDEEGNVIYATVKDGKYVIENVEVLAGWAKEGSVITAVYGGYGDLESSRVNATITVTKREAKATVDAVTAKAGETVTLTVKVTDDVTVTGGKVVFKLNGKTLRDDNGNVLYGTVSNGVATVTYTLPAKMSAKAYTLTAVFSSGIYNRVDANSTLTITN